MCFILEEDSNVAVEKLTVMKEVLLGTEPCKPKLDRSLKVRVYLLSSFVNLVFLKKTVCWRHNYIPVLSSRKFSYLLESEKRVERFRFDYHYRYHQGNMDQSDALSQSG
jgi:hypothetical protein